MILRFTRMYRLQPRPSSTPRESAKASTVVGYPNYLTLLCGPCFSHTSNPIQYHTPVNGWQVRVSVT